MRCKLFWIVPAAQAIARRALLTLTGRQSLWQLTLMNERTVMMATNQEARRASDSFYDAPEMASVPLSKLIHGERRPFYQTCNHKVAPEDSKLGFIFPNTVRPNNHHGFFHLKCHFCHEVIVLDYREGGDYFNRIFVMEMETYDFYYIDEITCGNCQTKSRMERNKLFVDTP